MAATGTLTVIVPLIDDSGTTVVEEEKEVQHHITLKLCQDNKTSRPV